jgi:hypothetical protein
LIVPPQLLQSGRPIIVTKRRDQSIRLPGHLQHFLANRCLSPKLLEMKAMKKKPGRPRKKEGVISHRDFARAGIVMSVFDEARGNGEKHSVAVAQCVQFIRQRYPRLRISETGVKRILSEFRPRKSQTILQFEQTVLDEQALMTFRTIQENLRNLQRTRTKGLNLPEPLGVGTVKPVSVFKIRFGERPHYARHNRKIPKE